MNEQVMVVERAVLEPYLVERGLMRERIDEVFDAIAEKHFFIDRATAETSPQYKQVIPYILIRYDDSWFLLQRTQKQTEVRLHDKLSLGIGGHINPETPDILDGLRKELDEEVEIGGDYDLTFVGILNDDTTDVGRVHLGVVYVLDTHERDVHVVETEKMSGRWVPREDLARHRDAMESWSQIAFDAIDHFPAKNTGSPDALSTVEP